MGFITNTANVSRMKHIDLRQSWIDTLRDKKIKFIRIPGEDNKADFFTKILSGPKTMEALEYMMKPLDMPSKGAC